MTKTATARRSPAKNKNPRRRGRPSQHEPSGDELRDLVIQTGRAVYAQYGTQRTSVALLLEAANISRPTFYRLFSSRLEVIDAIVTDANNRLRLAVFNQVTAAGNPAQAAVAAVDAYFGWCEEMGPLVGPIYSEINDPESPASGQRSKIIDEFVQLLNAQSERFGQARLDPVLLDTVVRAIEHAGSSAFWPSRGSDEQVARHRAAAVHILTASLGLFRDNVGGSPPF